MLKLGLWRQGAMQLVRASSPYLAAPPRREDACAMPYPRRSSPIRHGNRHSGDDGDASPLPGQSLASGVHVGRYLTSWSQHDLRRGSTVLDIRYGHGSAVSGLRARGHAAFGHVPGSGVAGTAFFRKCKVDSLLNCEVLAAIALALDLRSPCERPSSCRMLFFRTHDVWCRGVSQISGGRSRIRARTARRPRVCRAKNTPMYLGHGRGTRARWNLSAGGRTRIGSGDCLLHFGRT